jgi:tetratricopeptide (TPR) repeat protein
VVQNVQHELERLERQFYLRNRIAEAHLGIGNYHNARTLYEENHIIAEKWHDSELMANSLQNLGQVAQALGELETAKDLYEHSLKLYRDLNEQPAIANLLNYLGNVADEMGDQDEALRLYQESLGIARNIGGNWGMAGAVQQQQRIEKDTSSEYQEAKDALQKMLEAHQQNNNKHGLADTYYNLGYVAQNMNEFADAQQYYQEAITLRQDLQDKIGIAQTHERLGEIATQSSDYPTAEDNFQHALKIANELNETIFILYLLIAMSRLYITQNKQERAIEILSFILANAEDREKLQDSAEELVFEVEEKLDPAILQTAWEKGKNTSFADMVKGLIAS